MLRVILLLVLMTGSHAALANKVKEKPFYGEEIKVKAAIPLDTVLQNYAQYENSDVVMEAKVAKVCQKKGCWMTLEGSEKTFRVTFHNYGFFVPASLMGKKVWVQGPLKRTELSIEDTKHYLADAGASKEKIAAVTKPSFEYSIVAKGVRAVD